MSPSTTLIRLGSSSRLVWRSQRPMGVTRGSLSILKSTEFAPCLLRWRSDSLRASANRDQVGPLVEAGLAQPAADGRGAGIVVHLAAHRIRAVLVEMAQRLLAGLGVGHHGAELDHAEAPPAVAGALLHEEHRPGA